MYTINCKQNKVPLCDIKKIDENDYFNADEIRSFNDILIDDIVLQKLFICELIIKLFADDCFSNENCDFDTTNVNGFVDIFNVKFVSTLGKASCNILHLLLVQTKL